MVRGLFFAAAVFAALSAVQAASLDGISIPDVREVSGVRMHLNGIGIRTFSLLGIRVYVASLYLEHRSSNSDEILRSPNMKLISMLFLRDVDAEDARKAWQESFEQNCKAPCYLNPHYLQRFLTAIPSVRQGDECTFLITSRGAHVALNKKPVGDIADRHFAELILATFIGTAPPTPRLRRELLGLRD
jgi:hypothetical protein